MITRTHRHAHQRLDFEPDDPVPKRLAACKRFLRLESEMIRMRHRGGESGLKVAQARAALLDVMLQRLLEPALAPWAGTPDDPAVALVALGGYGRCELSPLSDIDIMFLHPNNVKRSVHADVQKKLTAEVLYIL